MQFWKLPVSIVTRSDMTTIDKIVYAYLLDRQGVNKTSWSSVPTIAKMIHVSERSVRKSIISLSKLGSISVTSRPGMTHQIMVNDSVNEQKADDLQNMTYSDYLQSQEWQETRSGALKRANYRCQLCNRSGRLNVHHRTYERRGREYASDLTVLCEECHAKHHGVKENV